MRKEYKTTAAQNIEKMRQIQQQGRYAYSGRRSYTENLFKDSGLKSNITYDRFGTEESRDEDGKGFFESIWSAALTLSGGIADDIKNVGRTFTKKLIDQFIDSDYKSIDDITQGQQDIELVLEYKNLKQELGEIQNRKVGTAFERFYTERQAYIENRLRELDSFFLGEGRTHAAIAKEMYDVDRMNLGDKLFVADRYIGRNQTPYGKETNFLDFLGKTVGNALSVGQETIDFALRRSGNLLGGVFGADWKGEYETSLVIGTLNPNAPKDYEFLQKLYKGNQDGVPNIDVDRLNSWKEENNRLLQERIAELKSDIKFSKDGKLFGIDIYDEEDIPKLFKDAQEKFGKNWYDYFIHPYNALLYSIPEVASTVGMYKYQAYALGFDGMLGYLSSRLPTWAMKGGPVSGAIMGAAGEFLAGRGGRAAMATAGYAAAVESRKVETGLEAMQAMGDRVSKLLYDEGGDVEKVVNTIRQRADRMGIDTSNMDLDKLLKLGIAFNINTGDDVYDSAKIEARKGLNKLINANNSLAIMDYLEALPFMSYSGKAMRDFAKNQARRVYGTNAMQTAVEELSKPFLQAASDVITRKAVKRFVEKGDIAKALATKHIGDYLVKGAALSARQAFLEGTEEGIQEILQNRYQRGLYDNDQSQYSLFDINEVFNDAGLAAEAFAAYLGYDPWDTELPIDLVRKAMNIGAVSSILFSKALSGSRNILSGDIEGSIRDLHSQLKNDKALANIISNFYDKVQDQHHLLLFVDAFTNAGINNTRLRKALVDLKNSVDENNTLVKKDYIDEDIRLMENAWALYNNKELTESVKKAGFDKYGDFHKLLIIEGAARITAQQKTEEQLQDDLKSLKNMQYRHNDIVLEMLDEYTSKERLKLLQDENPKLASMITLLKADYDDYLANRQSLRRGKFGAFVRKFDSVLKFLENEGIKEYITRNGLSESVVLHEDEEGYDPLTLLAKEIFTNDKERKKALRFAYDYENRKQYFKLLQNESSFVKNKYVRSAVRAEHENERDLNKRLHEIYRDKEKRNNFIELAYERYNEGTYSLNDYIQERIHIKHLADRLAILQKVKTIAKDKELRNKTVKAYQGLDVDTDLEGIVSSLDKQIKELLEKQKSDLRRLGPNATYAQFFEGKGFEFDDQEEFEKVWSRLFLNRAVHQNLTTIASAFLLGGNSPTSLSEALYGNNAESILDEDVKQYRQLIGKRNRKYSPDEDVSDDEDIEVIEHDIRELSKNAAWKVIKELVDKKILRRRIANRVFEEEVPSTPLQEEHAVLEEEAQVESETKPVTSTEAPMSDSEKNLRKKYNNEKNPETLQEKAERKRKQREEKAKAESSEEESSNEPEPLLTEVLPAPKVEENSSSAAIDTESESIEQELSPEEIVDDESEDEGFSANEPDEDEEILVEDDIEFEPNDSDDGLLEYLENEHKEDVEASNDVEFDNGWIDIEDYSLITINEDGNMEYDGYVLLDDLRELVEDDLILMGLSDQIGFDQNTLPDNINGIDKKKDASNESLGDLLSQTMFYLPNPKKKEDGTDELPWDGNPPVKLNKPLASGRQLSLNLSKKGWLQKTKKYFIVTQSELGKNIAPGHDPRDSFTVALIIEDENNCYATFLRPLGLTYSETKYDGHTIAVDSEDYWRNWLLSRNLDWRKIVQASGEDLTFDPNTKRVYKKLTNIYLTTAQKIQLYKRVINKIAKDRARESYYGNNGTYDGFDRFWNNDPVRENYRDEDSWKKAKSERKRFRKLFIDRARQSLALPGRRVLSDEQVTEQINALRTFRNLIIDKYISIDPNKKTIIFPSNARTDVKPKSVSLSNGRISRNRDKNGNPVYRTLESPDRTIDDIQSDIESGRLVFGYGLGMFANDKDRWAIRGLLDKDASTTHRYGKTLSNRSGLSGKIYWLVDSLTKSDKNVPVMLAEERFDTQIRNGKTIWLNNPKNLVLCLKYNPQTGKLENVNGQGYQPSAAEVIFYMLTGLLDSEFTAELQSEIAEFFIHSGEKTLLKNQPKSGSDPFGTLALKLLAWHSVEDSSGKSSMVLSIGMPTVIDVNGKKETIYALREFTRELLLDQSETGENLRREIVQAIATQMHWNTDLMHMNSTIDVMSDNPSAVSYLFRWAIRNFAKSFESNEDYLNQRVSIFGCQQLSFRIGDFFKLENGDIVPKKNVSVLAWMIKEGKLKTDTEETILKDPFVFANGVASENGDLGLELQDVAAQSESTDSNVIPVTLKPKQRAKTKPETQAGFNLRDLDLFNTIVNPARVRKGLSLAKTDEEAAAIREELNKTFAAKEHGGINDRVLIRPTGRIKPDEVKQKFDEILKDFLEKYNKQNPDNAVKFEDVQIGSVELSNLKSFWGNNKGCVILDLYGDHTGNVVVKNNNSNWSAVTGVFSKTGGSGTVDINHTRNWLSKVLGIDKGNVVVTNAVMRSTSNEPVYAFTNVILDRLTDEFEGIVKISTRSDYGVEYHEAWHYVNLLLHDEQERIALWKAYLNTHKYLKRKGVTWGDIEEAMADDFKLFMEGFENTSIKGKVSTFFNNVFNFLFATRNKRAYRRVFKQIAKGAYASIKIDEKSAKEFIDGYNKYGVFKIDHAMPNMSKEELQNLKLFNTYLDLLDGLDSVINRIFNNVDLSTPKKMQFVANKGFSYILETLDKMIGEQTDEDKRNKLQEIRDNQNILRKALIDAFMDLGIVAKIRKAEDVREVDRTEIREDALKAEDSPENIWDRVTLQAPRKQNASISTKMFLRRIPKYKKEYYEDGQVAYIPDNDEFGEPKAWNQDEAWRLILDNLWMCDSFSERDEDGNYSPTSIMGIVESQIDTNPFFHALYEKLEDLDYSGDYGDILLKSQIFAAVNSSKNQILVIKIQNPYQSNTSLEDDYSFSETELDTISDNGVVADKSRQWVILNDSLVLVARNVPRKWSKNLAANGLLSYNKKTKSSVINKDFANVISKKLLEISDIISKYSYKSENGKLVYSPKNLSNKLDELKPKIVNFYNLLGILCDILSLNVYIAMISGESGNLTSLQQFDALNEIFNTSKIGSISYIIGGIVDNANAGNSDVTPTGQKYVKAIDEAFNGYAADSHIGILALAWSAIHPSPIEFSVKDANNNRLYPINLNSFVSDRVRLMNERRKAFIDSLRKSPYCRHSVLGSVVDSIDPAKPNTKIKLNTFVGIRDANNAVGADYFGITAQEDYLSKLLMTEKDQIIFPTMADKPTWHSISCSGLKLSHDVMLVSPLDKDINKAIYEEYNKINPFDPKKYTSEYTYKREARKWFREEADEETKAIINAQAVSKLRSNPAQGVNYSVDSNNNVVPTFSGVTINRFAGYFLDEINTLLDYYSKENIKRIVSNKNARIENFHGAVKNGRMDFSGNGGKFRYLYDIPLSTHQYNFNQMMQALFELQKKIEGGKVIDVSSNDELYKFVGASVLKSKDLDGFELVREFLKRLKAECFELNGDSKQELRTAINLKLVDMTYQELYRISRPGSALKLVKYNSSTGRYIPESIPEQLLEPYIKVLQDNEYGSYGRPYEAADLLHHAVFSLIGNFVANEATSVIEVEKIFSGDPAFYKKKAISKIERFDTVSKFPKTGKSGIVYVDSSTETAYKYSDLGYYKLEDLSDSGVSAVTIARRFDNGQSLEEEIIVENLDDVFSDKIKRLGGLLSPGEEIRLDYSDDELLFDPSLKCTKYTNLNVEDIEIPSIFLNEILDLFKKQLLVDLIRCEKVEAFEKFYSDISLKRKKENERLKSEKKNLKPVITKEIAIDMLYQNEKYFDLVYNSLSASQRSNIETQLSQQIKPYKDITVADAQVFIRPALYRKIRIGLGQWSFEPDEDGYCDEDAYNILEGITVNEDGSRTQNLDNANNWMKDPSLLKYVKRLELYPLKMSYFQNDSQQITGNIFINRPIYNKMAIFPLFAFLRATSVGEKLYNRMNKAGNELDMVSFKSAVKVGAIQKGPLVVNTDESTESVLGSFNDLLNSNSDLSLDYSTGKVNSKRGDNLLGVTIQDLSNIRMQLNTKAHEATMRAIGTQMFKIAFSNIIDDAYYGTNKTGRKSRKGSDIKRDIVDCINALTRIGVENLKDRFYKNGVINEKAVEDFVKLVVKNNGLGISAEEIIYNGGTAASLISRTVFENSATAIVNDEVVDIKTKGGTAIQQSLFGFTGYGSLNVGVFSSNNGRELKWSASEGSMQVMLSMNFFKDVIPDFNNKTYEQQRQWLFDNNIIGDNAKPFGVGYRIPTQGMSSMFAFLVADVVPQQNGDLIIVPREFTAQTGSDFDVDKIFLATFSYRHGVFEDISDSEFKKGKYSSKTAWLKSLDYIHSVEERDKQEHPDQYISRWDDLVKEYHELIDNPLGAISNRLLLNYIDIISDRRNYANARASIDVITNTIHNDLLNPVLRKRRKTYIPGMTELLPSFQALRKMEFGVGKQGIAPFALNITNLALTQFTHLTIDFGEIGEEYGFGTLDLIYGKDGLRISDWLSAMVNAHVDVAKDPYVFDLNVNKATYNHANLLLRAGMGESTFTFLAQPALKDFAENLINSGGLYGDNIDGDVIESENNSKRRKNIYKLKVRYYNSILNNILLNFDLSKLLEVKAKSAHEYFEWMIMTAKERRDNGYDKDAPARPIERKYIFDENYGKQSILNFATGADITELNVDKVIDSIIFLISALLTFMELDDFARSLSSLVQCSRVDNRKYGNTIAQNIQYQNKVDNFKYGDSNFTINKPDFEKTVAPSNPEVGVTKSDISRAALKRYFGELYLDDKLDNATFWIKEILSTQLFSATPLYESIFKNILGIIGGYTSFGGFKSVFSEQSINAISQGLDNVMRFNALMAYGPQIFENAQNSDPDTNMIDLTLGGDISAVSLKFDQLVNGRNKTESIFLRLSNFIRDVRENPYEEYSEDLVNDDGEIINDLLLYLSPQTPNEKYPIGKMNFTESQTDNNSSQERRLISAFALLLSHNSERVRNLAQDLVFYAYYSTYDTNVANSFFHLVPIEYRKQYDDSLKFALKLMNSNDSRLINKVLLDVSGLTDISNTEDIEALAASNILDVLSRNYWYDSSIVPIHILTTNPTKNGFQSSTREVLEFTGHDIYDEESGRSFPTFIATTRVSGDSRFVKIRKGTSSFLYRKIGVVDRSYKEEENATDNAKKNRVKPNKYSIYIAVPKAGIRSGNITQFELYCNYSTLSIFDTNILDVDYAEDNVRKEINEYLLDGDYKLNLIWDYDEIPDMYLSSNTKSYVDTSTPADQPVKRSITGATILGKKSGEYSGQYNADITIDIVQSPTEGDVERPNIKKLKNGVENNVVELALVGDISDTIKKIKDIKQENVKIHLSTVRFDGQFDVSDEEINDYINQQLDIYKQFYFGDDLDSALEAKRLALVADKRTKQNVIQNKLNSRIYEFVLQLINSGVSIDKFSAAVSNDKTHLAKTVMYLKSQIGLNFGSDNMSIYVDKEFTQKKKKFNRLLSQLGDIVGGSESSIEQDLNIDSSIDVPVQEIDGISEQATTSNVSRISRFESATGFDLSESSEESNDIPPILKLVQDVEQDKENSKNQECAGGSRFSRFENATGSFEVE